MQDWGLWCSGGLRSSQAMIQIQWHIVRRLGAFRISTTYEKYWICLILSIGWRLGPSLLSWWGCGSWQTTIPRRTWSERQRLHLFLNLSYRKAQGGFLDKHVFSQVCIKELLKVFQYFRFCSLDRSWLEVGIIPAWPHDHHHLFDTVP